MFKKASEKQKPKEVYRDDEIVGYIIPPDLDKGSKIDELRIYQKASELVTRCKGCGVIIPKSELITYCKACLTI